MTRSQRHPARVVQGQREVTPDLVRQALACIPPNIAHDDRMRIFAAAWDGVGDSAEAMCLDWAGERSKPDGAEDLAMWKSVRKPGKVKVGTLFFQAKKHGFRFPEKDTVAPAPDPAEAERVRAEREQRHAKTEAEYRARADGAAKAARRMWDGASEAGSSAYLERKGVKGHGVRYRADGALLVPMRNAAGELMNLQTIAPAPPADGPEKRYLGGGRKSGLWHLLGQADGAAVVLLAEGYATAATLHEATGRPVAVCFDAGNLPNVARALRQLHPTALLLVCGDDDRETEQRTGTNAGRKYAAAAARAVLADGAPAGAVFPEGLPEGGTDFNDLAAHAGLEAVRDQVEPAMAAPTVPKPRRSPKTGAGEANAGEGEAEAQAPAEGAPRSAEPDRWGFFVNERGVFYAPRDRDGDRKKPVWLCAPLFVPARTRTDDANGWGYLLEFNDFDGNPKSWAMPSALLSGEGAEWAARLRDMGLDMAVGPGLRTNLATYINTRGPEDRVTCTDRVGWHGPVYVLPSSTIGPSDGRRFVFQSDGSVEDTFRQRADLAAWQRDVAALCAGNSRLAFAVCCALAGPLLPFSGLEGGGFHLRGDSRGGKTTALRAAASVFGGQRYMQQWRTTSNALESTAVQHNHALLVLDELGQLDPREAGDTAYLLANGMDKGRATRTILPRKRRTWQLLFLSSGEVGMSDLMADAGKRVRAGQEVRMVDVPLDAGAGMGGLEDRHAFESAAELAEALKDGACRSYGTAGRTWLQWCADHHRELSERTRDLVERYRGEFVPDAASGQVRTVGSRFALVAAAGEMATAAGITGWKAGHAAWAVRRCFEAWLGARGHLDNGEEMAMLRQVRTTLERDGESLFTWTHRALDDHKPNTPHRLGFKRLTDEHGKPLRVDSATDYLARRSAPESGELATAEVEYLVLPEQFRAVVCKGFDANVVARVLRSRGHLVHEDKRLTNKVRLPGMGRPVPCFQVRPSIFGDEA